MTRKKRIELVLVRHRRGQISYSNMKGRKRKKSALEKLWGFWIYTEKGRQKDFAFIILQVLLPLPA
jgi:hypothetical protein